MSKTLFLKSNLNSRCIPLLTFFIPLFNKGRKIGRLKRLSIVIIFWVLIPLFSVTSSNLEKISGNEFLIEGELSGVEDGEVIGLIRWDGDAGTSIATDTVKNGCFFFKMKTEFDVELLGIETDFSNQFLNVWVAPGVTTKIKGNKMIQLWEVESSILYQIEENRYTKKSRDIIAERVHLSIEADEIRAKTKTATSEKEALAYRKTIDSLETIRKSLIRKDILLYSEKS